MPNTEHFPENWPSWEIDPSTRTSVHVWNKYIPIDVSVGTSAVDLVTVSRGEPSVNLVTNPSIEHATISEFTASGSAISQSSAQAAHGSNSLLVNPDNPYHWMSIKCTVAQEVREEDDPGVTKQLDKIWTKYTGNEPPYGLRDPSIEEKRVLFRCRIDRIATFGKP